MTSPLQVLYFMAITLAPPGTHHITVTGGAEVYGWDRGDSANDVTTWVYDCAAVDPQQVLVNNDIVPENVARAQNAVVRTSHHNWSPHFVLEFDPQHQLQKNSQGYVYIVRPGAANEKFYSFTFRP
jgi:hypothetical protein